jgi:3-hydroxyacyl-CoA dehydrogenase/enoyl-CoA hydratase/3-hydroxybutyryl-CoA epimerase
MQNFLHLSIRPDSEQRIWIDIRVHGDTPGVLSAGILTELQQCLEFFKAQNSRGFVLRFTGSGQQGQQRTGTDDAALCPPTTRDRHLALISHTQQVAESIQNIAAPTVFVLNKYCPAGGIALALATDYCITSFAHTTENSLPDNIAGLHPAPYVVKRLIDRVGTTDALSTLTSPPAGVTLTQENFHSNVFVDLCMADDQLHEVAINFIDRKPAKKQAGLTEKIQNSSLLRALTAKQLERRLQKENPLNASHYPAPYALLRLWAQYGTRTDDAALQAYAQSLAELSNTPQANGLQNTIHLRNSLQNGVTSTRPARTLKHLHLIDGGDSSASLASLGSTSYLIASHCLLQGIKVSIQTHRKEALERLTSRISEKLTAILRDNPAYRSKLLSNLHFDPQGENISSADMILLVDSADLASQQEKFAELEEFSRPDAILATHSSIISIDNISAALLKPERLLGIHFCYPASTTPLVEISATATTSPELPERAAQLLRSVNKLPLLLNNTPGLLVNRILMQYILRGIQLHQQGVPHTIIDSAGRSAGMSAGPLELADRMGLDYCLQVAGALEKAFGMIVPYELITMVQTGKLGRKSGSGFYRYRNNRRLKPARVDWEGNIKALEDKLTSQIAEEAAVCLEDGVTEDPDLINAGIIFGTGFAAWTGDPLHFQHSRQKNDRRAQ